MKTLGRDEVRLPNRKKNMVWGREWQEPKLERQAECHGGLTAPV